MKTSFVRIVAWKASTFPTPSQTVEAQSLTAGGGTALTFKEVTHTVTDPYFMHVRCTMPDLGGGFFEAHGMPTIADNDEATEVGESIILKNLDVLCVCGLSVTLFCMQKSRD